MLKLTSIEGEAVYAGLMLDLVIAILVQTGLVPRQLMLDLLDTTLVTFEEDIHADESEVRRSPAAREHARGRLENLISML